MRARHAVLAMLSAAAAAACGGGGSSGYPTTPSGGGGGGGSGTTPPSASVTIADYSFSPSSITIKAGGTVTWTNSGSLAHTATANDGSWDSGQLAGTGGGGYGGGGGGGIATINFATAGTFNYHCANHTSMMGTVTVTP